MLIDMRERAVESVLGSCWLLFDIEKVFKGNTGNYLQERYILGAGIPSVSANCPSQREPAGFYPKALHQMNALVNVNKNAILSLLGQSWMCFRDV